VSATDAMRRHRHEAYGALSVLALLLIIGLVIAAYLQAFTPFITVTLKTDRAGLLLERDSDVTMRSIRIGKVGGVEPDGPGGAAIEVWIDPEQVDFIPANVQGQLIAPTLFGPKTVDLIQPPTPTERRISTGDVILRPQVQVEANVAFDNLIVLLQTIEPAKLNSALGALSTSLQGRGEQLGDYLADLNQYLERLNASLPALRADLATAPGVIDTYADVSPDLLRIVGNLTTTSNTIVEEKPALDAFILSFTRFSDTAQSFLEQNERGLVETLDVLRPTTALLQRYSPMFPCLFNSANTLRKYTEPAFGGTKPGLHTLTSFLPGQEPYKYPENLPRLGVDAPGCYGGAPEPGNVPRHTFFPDGSPRLDTRDNPPTIGDEDSLAAILFGELGPTIPPILQPAAGALPALPGLPGAGRSEGGDR
jgi:phospholipid/cholesterol/gamma-HCH transport system substrate-binding protein